MKNVARIRSDKPKWKRGKKKKLSAGFNTGVGYVHVQKLG